MNDKDVWVAYGMMACFIALVVLLGLGLIK